MQVQVRAKRGWRTLQLHTYEFTVSKSYDPVGLNINGYRFTGPWRVLVDGNVIHQTAGNR